MDSLRAFENVGYWVEGIYKALESLACLDRLCSLGFFSQEPLFDISSSLSEVKGLHPLA